MENSEGQPKLNDETILSDSRDYLEKVMGRLPPENSEQERKSYLCGIIDCLADIKAITENQREVLYLDYGM